MYAMGVVSVETINAHPICPITWKNVKHNQASLKISEVYLSPTTDLYFKDLDNMGANDFSSTNVSSVLS